MALKYDYKPPAPRKVFDKATAINLGDSVLEWLEKALTVLHPDNWEWNSSTGYRLRRKLHLPKLEWSHEKAPGVRHSITLRVPDIPKRTSHFHHRSAVKAFYAAVDEMLALVGLLLRETTPEHRKRFRQMRKEWEAMT